MALLLANLPPVEYHNTTTLHPLGLLAVVALGSALLVLPRRWAPLPMIVMACFVASAQRVVVGGLDFSLLRIMVLFGTVRVLMWQEWRGFRWVPLDWAIIGWAVVGTITYTIQRGTGDALVFKLGASYDAIGMYFLFRCLFRSWEDVDRLALGLTLVAFPVLVCFAIEKATGRNMFAIFGGVPEVTPVREGRLRCQGAFSHAIMAGCFWAAALPLIAARWWRADWTSRCLAAAGVGAALLIVVFCSSSTPAMGVMAAAGAAALFPLRHWMSWIRWGTVASLVFLHFAMQAPVWHLISRIDITGGSTGWHRYHLIDQAIKRFTEWAAVGTPSTAHWGHGLFDVTNQYVLEGVTGGVLALSAFVLVLVLCFRSLGRGLRRDAASRATETAVLWGLGCALAVHCSHFLAVAYFGQMWSMLFVFFAAAGSVAPVARQLHSPLVHTSTRVVQHHCIATA